MTTIWIKNYPNCHWLTDLDILIDYQKLYSWYGWQRNVEFESISITIKMCTFIKIDALHLYSVLLIRSEFNLRISIEFKNQLFVLIDAYSSGITFDRTFLISTFKV